MLFSFFDAVDWSAARLSDATSFLRSIPSLLAPKPSALGLPYTPAFTGGQTVGVVYKVFPILYFADGYVYQPDVFIQVDGAIRDAKAVPYSNGSALVGVDLQAQGATVFAQSRVSAGGNVIVGGAVRIVRADGQPETPVPPPNPNPAPNINDDGLFSPNNPVIGDENGTLNSASIILSPAAPLILIGGGLAAAAAAAAAAQAASDALAAIKKVAESLDALKKLWEKLQEFLEEWEKDRPKNRDIVRQTYGSIEGDGAIDFYPLSNKNFAGIQVDIVVTEVPLGFGKYFGSMSPSRYRYKELGYISFYSINKGIIETHSIQFKRSSLAIPKTAVGFIYHFGLDNKIKGFAFGTFSVRKT